MGQIIYHKLPGLRRPISEKVPNAATGTMWKVVGYEIFDVELEIDIDAIARQLGSQAGRNRTSKAVGLKGLITARATNRRREP